MKIKKAISLPWLLLLPTFVIVLSIFLYPLFYSFRVSLYSTTLSREGEFVGFENYINLTQDQLFTGTCWRATYFAVGLTSMQLLLGIGLGILFNSKVPGVRKLRTLLIIPLMMTGVVISYGWRIVFFPVEGALNVLLEFLGLPPQVWLASELLTPFVMMLVDTWRNAPFVAFIVIAGLQSVRQDLIDAAMVDGASKMQVFRHVTWPTLKPLIAIATVFVIMRPFWAFDIVYVLTMGGPGTSTYLPSFLLHRYVFRSFEVSKGMAASYLFLIVVIALTYFLIKRIEEYIEL